MNAKTEIVMVSLVFLLLAGCGLIPARIKSGDVTVSAPKDNGSPATLDKGETKTSVDIPAGTKVITTKTESTPTAPSVTVTEYDFTKPTHFEETSSSLKAGTGTIDTSVANHKVDVASRTPLLYAAILALVVSAGMVYFEHPTGALLCGAASGIFFLSWKLSDLPEWVWAVAAAAVVGGLCLVAGHNKGVKNTLTALITPTKTP